MASTRQMTPSPQLQDDRWLDLRDERTTELLHHLRSDNRAFEMLRKALEADFAEVRRAERDPAWLDALA
ncbi:hypothetical protein [Aureimonas sp. AU12]|uniref:hypothetical protein n=1 Tax=Aureimonas sp. AU12 TaxID=1638161 RepID=UPI000784E459|nr:hypothetical protein [Aureimonas sp. AU12]